jgi:hypothetical protein
MIERTLAAGLGRPRHAAGNLQIELRSKLRRHPRLVRWMFADAAGLPGSY